MILQNKLMTFLIGLFLIIINPTIGFAVWQQPPTQFTTDIASSTGDLASDDSGHGIFLIANNETPSLTAYYNDNGTFLPPQVIYNGQIQLFELSIDMDATGTAIAAWINPASELITGRFSAGVWSSPLPNPLDVDALTLGEVSMNGTGNALLVWKNGGNILRYSKFTGTSWDLPQTFGSADTTNFSTAYSVNGTGVTVFGDISGDVIAYNYTGATWTGPFLIGVDFFSSPEVGIDSTGKAVASWGDSFGNIFTSIFDGATWSPATLLFTGSGNFGISLDMAPNGLATLIFSDSLGNGYYSSFNGTSFSAPIIYASNLTHFDVSVNSAGNALIVYSDEVALEYRSRLLLANGLLLPVQFIAPITTDDGIEASLSGNGVGFSLWSTQFGEEDNDLFGSVFLSNPTPPLGISGKTCKQKFASQTEHIHIISWIPSIDPLVTSYQIRRNGTLIETVPSTGPFIFADRNRCRRDTYTVTAVTLTGFSSTSLTITLR